MKRFKYVFSLLFLTIALGVATYSATIKKNFFSARSAVGGYTLILSSSNCGALPKTRKSTVQQTDSASSDFDRTNCNFFRFHISGASCTYYIDDIDFLYES